MNFDNEQGNYAYNDNGANNMQYSQNPHNYSQRKINIWTGSYNDERPILEELGIDFKVIITRAIFVLKPLAQKNHHIHFGEADLAGPFVFCLLFGFFLLLTGKVHFGYIYGMGLIGCTSMWLLLNLMCNRGKSISLLKTASILGYCLLPMVCLAGASILLPLTNLLGHLLGWVIVFWCSKSASSMFISDLEMKDQFLLILYPLLLVYACFSLLTLF